MPSRLPLALLLAAVLPGCCPPPPAPPVTPAAGPAPCARWAERICDDQGEDADPCSAALSAAEFLPESACAAALAEVEASLTQLRELRASCTELGRLVCEEFGEASRPCLLVRARLSSFAAEECRAMVAEYDEVSQQLRCLEAGDTLAPEQWAVLLDGSPPSFGPASAPATLVVFSDFECPYCGLAAAAVEQVRARWPDGAVRVVFRQFPLERHPNAGLAAQASLLAAAQGRFWEFHDLVFASQEQLDPPTLERLAVEAGLDAAAYRAALRDETFRAAVEADLALGAASCVSGTPALFLNGEHLRIDPRVPQELLDAIQQVLDRSAPPPDAPAPPLLEPAVPSPGEEDAP
jgi:protein-disulfide isomerase